MEWKKKLWRIPAGLVVLSVLGTVWLERSMSAQLEDSARREIVAMRNLSASLLGEWATTQKRLALIALDSGPTKAALAQTLAHAVGSEGRESEAPRVVRQLLAPVVEQWGYDGFYLWKKGRVIAAYRDDQLGRVVGTAELGLSRRPLRGEALVGKPQSLKLDLSSDERHYFWTAVGVGRPEDEAFVAFRVSTDKTLAHLFRGATFGRTGESYAVSEKGHFLTEPRFREAIHADPRDGGFHQRRVQIGGEDGGKLTLAAEGLLAGQTGASGVGYPDYRGELVVGAWIWLPELGLGLVSEIDRNEALEPLLLPSRVARSVSLLLVLGTLGLLAMSRYAERFAHRAARAVRLGQYVLERKIGEGGMGSVYRARHALLRRPTAIKLLTGEDATGTRVARFEREVQLTAELCHPNTIQVFDYGRTEDGTFYYAMEFLEGYSLWDAVVQAGAMPERRVLRILEQVLGSLAEAHERGLVHRDIKPANIMLTNRGGIADFVKVLDFGLVKDQSEEDNAHLTQARTLTGTPQYMAPEVILNSEQASQLSDIYAVGCVAYYLLTGAVLFDGNNLPSVISQHLTVPATRFAEKFGLELHPELEGFVLSCLEKAPEKRPPSARAAIALLEELRPRLSGRWTDEDAAKWWKAHPSQGLSLSTIESQETVALDLATRTGTGSAASRSGSNVIVRQVS